jgi:hypothetical protein
VVVTLLRRVLMCAALCAPTPCCCSLVLLQVWRANDMGGWDEEQTLHGHKDWVRDAAWAPNLGMPLNTIASVGQDGQVRVCVCSCVCECVMGGQHEGRGGGEKQWLRVVGQNHEESEGLAAESTCNVIVCINVCRSSLGRSSRTGPGK